MKSEAETILNVVQTNLKESLFNNAYVFEMRDRSVRVVFSDKPDAPSFEEALVKIAIKKIG